MSEVGAFDEVAALKWQIMRMEGCAAEAIFGCPTENSHRLKS